MHNKPSQLLAAALASLPPILASAALSFAQVPPPVPALPDTERRTQYSISASTCACAVGFQLYGSGSDVDQWIEVWIGATRYLSTDSTHGWSLASATGSLGTIPRPITNAVLTFAAVQTGTVQIVGAERPRRAVQFTNNLPVSARDLNQIFTDVFAQNRETWDRTNDISGRTIRANPGETLSSLPAATTRANQFLVFNSQGDVSLAAPGLGLGNVVGPVSAVNGHVAVFSGTDGKILADGGTVGTVNLTGDVTGSGAINVTTVLATINSNVGSFGSATQCLNVTVNGKGLITAASVVTCAPAFSSLTGQATLAQLPTIANNTVLINNTGGPSVPAAGSPSALFDMISATQGTILYRDAAGWLALAPGTSGQLLQTGGPNANPSWLTASGTGTLTSLAVDHSLKTDQASSGPITATGTLSLYGDTGSISNCSIVASVSGNALTVALKAGNGNDPSATNPCWGSFRDATVTVGDYAFRKVTAATAFVTAASGSTFGTSNSVPFRLWVTAWDNAGTIVLGVSKQSSATQVYPLNEAAVQSSTACNACGTATSAGVFYTTAAQTSLPIRIIGYLDWGAGLATAGVWASAPTLIQLMGPGVRKPGDLVQSVMATTATNGISYSVTTAFQNSLTVTLTPTAAPNLVKARCESTISMNGTNTAYARVIRGTSGNVQVGANAAVGNGAAATTAFSLGGYDAPGTTSSTTYTLQGRTANTGSSFTMPIGDTANSNPVAACMADEIMG